MTLTAVHPNFTVRAASFASDLLNVFHLQGFLLFSMCLTVHITVAK